jgi:hypothetical protein
MRRKDLCDVAQCFEGEAEDLQYVAADALGEFAPIGREMEAAANEIIQACKHLRAIAASMKRTRGGKRAETAAVGSINHHNGAGVPLAAAQA